MTPSFSFGPGQQLFQHAEAFAEEFYLWLLSHASGLHLHTRTRQLIIIVMRIADVSRLKGGFISELEEKQAIDKLLKMKQGFSQGEIKHLELPLELDLLIQNLTICNVKAKLVAHTTELEYIFCIQPMQKHSQETRMHLQKVLKRINEEITPHFPDYKAQALAQGLSTLMKNPHTLEDPLHSLNLAIEGWI
jgi:hypothetical protein